MVCKADELITMKKADYRKFVDGCRAVYIYHNVIDNEVENAREAYTFAAACMDILLPCRC